MGHRAEEAGKRADWEGKARLAIVALHLGELATLFVTSTGWPKYSAHASW